jgi:hypothetical protein
MLALESHCGRPLVTTVLAELNGRRISDDLSADEASTSCVMRSHAAVMAKGAELHGTVAVAASDLTITPTEAMVADRKAADMIESLQKLRLDLARVRAGEIPPNVRTSTEPGA